MTFRQIRAYEKMMEYIVDPENEAIYELIGVRVGRQGYPTPILYYLTFELR